MIDHLAQAPLQHHHPFAFSVDFFSVGIPLLLALGVPLVAFVIRKLRKTDGKLWTDWWMPFTAGLVWFWAIQLPNIPVTDKSESTLMHFLGGALVAPLLYYYLARAGKFVLPDRWYLRALAFYSFTFVLFGCGNELLEFVMVKLLHSKIELADTWLDLLTDFVGNTTAFAAMEFARCRRSAFRLAPSARTPSSVL